MKGTTKNPSTTTHFQVYKMRRCARMAHRGDATVEEQDVICNGGLVSMVQGPPVLLKASKWMHTPQNLYTDPI